MNKITIHNGPADIRLDSATVGAQLKFALYVEVQQTDGTFLPMNLLAGVVISCEVRKQNLLEAATPLATFTPTPRALEPGWCDFLLLGDATTVLGADDFEASVKIWPTGSPTHGDILANVQFPLRWGGTH